MSADGAVKLRGNTVPHIDSAVQKVCASTKLVAAMQKVGAAKTVELKAVDLALESDKLYAVEKSSAMKIDCVSAIHDRDDLVDNSDNGTTSGGYQVVISDRYRKRKKKRSNSNSDPNFESVKLNALIQQLQKDLTIAHEENRSLMAKLDSVIKSQEETVQKLSLAHGREMAFHRTIADLQRKLDIQMGKSMPAFTLYDVGVKEISGILNQRYRSGEFSISFLRPSVPSLKFRGLNIYEEVRTLLTERGYKFHTHMPRSLLPYMLVIENLTDEFSSDEVKDFFRNKVLFPVEIIGLNSISPSK